MEIGQAMPDADLLRGLFDRQAITDLLYRYCRSMDRMDAELGYSIWHADGLADYGEAIFQGTGRGFVDYACSTHRHLLVHSHQITNILIDLDGDKAGSEACYTGNLRMQAGDQIKQISVWGRYLDRWSRRIGQWGIDKRQTIIDFDEIRDVVPLGQPWHGSRDASDPSYAVLGKYSARAS